MMTRMMKRVVGEVHETEPKSEWRARSTLAMDDWRILNDRRRESPIVHRKHKTPPTRYASAGQWVYIFLEWSGRLDLNQRPPAPEEWGEIFGGEVMAAALIDRL